ncbi:nyd-sp30 tubulin tyrosine ligase-related [Schistosoma mansoni]|uniref:nyd-sp30 tubulin tyrosine ligase-related n=1 Tax=Schistosoma mansoni TaxID=6183 RepID=UPI0001A63681|nr:nyd-sp30 tubulin tyrosine ligase-related [Schistosoma mansoni]|eukprot:XP_018652815.1 nyd-sp30 tubulin tyrosine ligase-related [Schistosoma mansoni]
MQLRYLIWSDNVLPLERIMKLEPYQRANHFPGMIEICRKDLLTKNFSRMQKAEPDEYNFMPNTWILPQEYGYFSNYARKLYRQGCNPCFIQKPANGAMGHGNSLTTIGERLPNFVDCVIQEYIEHPLLIDGYKCDLRVYVLVTSCDPLKIFIYNEGLVRLSAEKYVKPSEPNGDSIYRQLTNYSINKHHIEYHHSPDDISVKQYSTMNNKQFMFNNHPKQPSKTMSTLTSIIPSTIHKSKVFNMNPNKTSFIPSDKSRVEKQQKLTTRKRLYNSHSVQTQNWMYKSNLNIRNDKIHKYFDNNRSSIKKHTNHELFHRDNVNLKTNHQSPFAYQLDIDYLKLMNDQDHEDDIYDELSKLIKKESKLKPGINVEQYLASVWSHCVDNRDTSDNIDSSSSLEDDDIHNGGNFVHNSLNENYHFSYTKHNENSTNRIHLQNDYFIKSSIDRKMKSMPTLSILPPLKYVSFNGANLKLNSAPVSPCKFLLNENPNVTKQMTDKLSLGKKWKSLDIERNLKHANKRIQTNDYVNNTIAQVSFRPTNQNGGHDNTQLVGDIGDDQSSMGYIDSTNKYLSCTTRSDQKKTSNSKSIASIKVGKHEMNILLDFNNTSNNLHNFKLSSSHLINNKDDYLNKSSMNDQFIPKQLCLLPMIHWNYCTLNEIVPSLFKNKQDQSTLISSDYLPNEDICKQFENGLMNKFIRGLRITRLLNRIKSRLLINHGYLLKSIIQMIPKQREDVFQTLTTTSGAVRVFFNSMWLVYRNMDKLKYFNSTSLLLPK